MCHFGCKPEPSALGLVSWTACSHLLEDIAKHAIRIRSRMSTRRVSRRSTRRSPRGILEELREVLEKAPARLLLLKLAGRLVRERRTRPGAEERVVLCAARRVGQNIVCVRYGLLG